MGLAAKIIGFIVVLAVGSVAVVMIIASAETIVAMLGLPASNPSSAVSYLLYASAIILVGALLVIPGILALFGHGGPWFTRVSLRYAKSLFLALGLSFAVYVAGSAISSSGLAPLAASLSTATGAWVFLLFVPILVAPRVVTDCMWKIAGVSAGAVSTLAGGAKIRKGTTATIVLTQLPLEHVRRKEESDAKERIIRFQRLAQTLAELGSTVEFRMRFADGFGRVTL